MQLKKEAPSILLVFAIICVLIGCFWWLGTRPPPTKYPQLDARQDLCRSYMVKVAPCIVARHPDVTDWCQVASGYTSNALADCE